MGKLLAERAQAVIETLPYEEDVSLDWKMHHVKLPIRDVEPELLAQSKKILEENPEPAWLEQNPKQIDPEWIKAASILSVHLRKERGTGTRLRDSSVSGGANGVCRSAG